MKQTTIAKRITAVIVILMMLIGILPAEKTYGTSFGNFNVAQKGMTAKAATTPANPVYNAATDTTTWSYVYFGSYPQSKVTGGDLTAAITGASYDSNGDATVNGVKYRRMKKSDATYSSTSSGYYNWTTGGDADGYHYFKYEPIKWRVLQNDGTDLFLFADQGLDDQRYNETSTSVTWETSTIRSWLNGYGASANKNGINYSAGKNFMNTAFTSAEQAAIANTTIVNDNNPYYGTAGGNDTTDKIFLLSIEEVINETYGFSSDYSKYSESRRMKTSDYGHAMGTWTNTYTEYFGNTWWWLRSPGRRTNCAADVHYYGYVNRSGAYVSYDDDSVCPALKIHLSSDLWSSDINHLTDYTISSTSDKSIQITLRKSGAQLFETIESGKVSLESFGEKLSNSDGKVSFENTFTDSPSTKKHLKVQAEGFRDYIADIVIYHKDVEPLFQLNEYSLSLKKLQEGDDTRPYISTLMYYSDYSKPRDILNGLQIFTKESDFIVNLKMYGVWHDKTPSKYILYQENGIRMESDNGEFSVNINSLEEKKKIYAQMIATDGTTSISETTGIEIRGAMKKNNSLEDGKIDLFPELTTPLSADIPFFSNDSIKMKLPIPVTCSIKGDKLRVAVGLTKAIPGEGDGKLVLADDENWSEWKKLCESASAKDNSLKDWKEAIKATKMHYTVGVSLDSNVIGYYEINMNTDDRYQEGGIVLSSDLKAEFQSQYVVGPVPVYLKFGLGLEGKAEVNGGYNYTEGKFYGDFKGEIAPYLSAEGGVGVLYVATVGVEGKGSLPTKISITEGVKSIELKGELALKATVLGFTYKKEFASKVWWQYPEKVKQTKNMNLFGDSNTSETEDYELMSRDYAKEESVWYGDKPISKIIKAFRMNGTEERLQSNIYPYAQPNMTEVGDTYVATWLADNTSRSAANRTMLVYSIYNKETKSWSEPKAVADDGTADFYPSIASNGETLFITWQNIEQDFTDEDASMDLFAKRSQIMIAEFNPDTNEFTSVQQITNNEKLDMMPNVAINDLGEATVAWVRNSENDIYGQNGTNTILYASASDKTEKTLQDNLNTIVSLDTEYVNGDYTVAYCLEEDGDLSTLEDRNLYVKTPSKKAVVISSDEKMNSNPKYGFYKGQKTLFFYSGDSIQAYLPTGTIETVYEDTDGSLSDDFIVISSEKSDAISIAWTNVTEEEKKQITGVIYNADSKTWSKEIVISDSTANVYFPDGVIQPDGTMLFMYNRTEEALETSQSDLCLIELIPSYDISVNEVFYEEKDLTPNNAMPVSVSVKNKGFLPVDSIVVKIGDQESMISQRIEPGEQKKLTVYYQVPSVVVRETLEVSVNIPDETDSILTDNQTSITWGYADAAMVMEDLVQDDGHLVNLTIMNETSIPTEGKLTIRKNDKEGEILDTIPLDTITKESVQTINYVVSNALSEKIPDLVTLHFVLESEEDEIYYSNNYDFIALVTEKEDAAVLCTFITLDKTDITMKLGETDILMTTILPENASNKEIMWSGSNEEVITVSQTGEVTAVGKGEAVITCTAVDGSGVKASCNIICKEMDEENEPSPTPSVTETPEPTRTPTTSPTPTASPVLPPTKAPTASPIPSTKAPTASPAPPTKAPTASPVPPTKAPTASPKPIPAKGKTYTIGNYKYIVTKSAAKNGTVALQAPKNNSLSKVSIPATVKINNYTFKVTAISAKAFQNNKKLKTVTTGSNTITIGNQAFAGCTVLTKVTVGKNVTTLGKNVFSGDKKLKNIVIQSEKLKKVGAKTFSNIHAKATIKVPKKKLSTYQTLLKGKGQKKTIKIK